MNRPLIDGRRRAARNSSEKMGARDKITKASALETGI
jgi:hypothetical protein